jgi:hypothetical protein
MRKLFIAAIATSLLSACGGTSAESEELLKSVYALQSKTAAGISYDDYAREAQELQVKLDAFERNDKSGRLKYGANLAFSASVLISAAERNQDGEWKPRTGWNVANMAIQTLDECLEKNRNCYKLAENSALVTYLLNQ